MRILVLAGGDTDEREVSLRSGSSVADVLKTAGHRVSLFDPAHAELTAALADKFDVAFPVIHGRGGEDGQLQQQLEDIGLAYVGSDVASSKLCFDKWEYRQTVTKAGLPMPDGVAVSEAEYAAHPLAKVPHVLKPIQGGSSIDTFIVRNPAKTPQDVISQAFGRHPTMLLEKLIDGVELTVGILGEAALPVIEIIPPDGAEFDYENKYNGASQELCPPQHVSPELQTKAQELALQAHRLGGCRDYSRTDIMLNARDEMFLLETNTSPGMTDQSLFPKMALTTGLTMPELCDHLVQMAFKRRAALAA